MKTSKRSRRTRLLARYYPQTLTWLLLILVLNPAIWQIPSAVAHGQTSGSRRFTESLELQEVESGIEYGQTSSGHASKDEMTGPWFINVLRIDPNRARLKVVHALDEGVGLETVSSLAARYRAPAATNGGYFRIAGTYLGESLGLLVLDRQLFSEPHNERAGFGLMDTGNKTELIFGHLRFAGDISIGSEKYSVQGLNRPVSSDELIIFTPQFHLTTLTNPDGIEVTVRRKRVTAVSDLKGSSDIPADGYVISAVGRAREWVKTHIRKGSKVNFTWQLNSIEPGNHADWLRIYSILGGGPQLIKEGKIAITDKEEKMAAGFATDRHPRTAIANLESGRILLVTVDGRQPGISAGMTLEMLADLLLEFGAIDAVNLDGGGFTTTFVHNKIVNRPSDQTGERPVSDAILIFPKPN